MGGPVPSRHARRTGTSPRGLTPGQGATRDLAMTRVG
jgi:hypothetical protein